MRREEIRAEAIGDEGNLTRACRALEALHRAGWRVQQPPTCSQALAHSLRERGLHGDADAVDALGMELDLLRRGWGPSTPTEQMLRRSDLITVRSFLGSAYDSLFEINPNNYNPDDVEQLNQGSIEAVSAISDALTWINDRIVSMAAPRLPDVAEEADRIAAITRDIATA